MRSLLSTHPLNLDGQSGVNLCGCFTGQLNPQIQVAPSLLRPAKAQACCTHLPTWPGSVRANARPLRRDAWLLQGSGLDHKEVLELLEEGEGCIDLDMAGKIRSNLRVLGDMSIVMLNARGYQFFSHLYGESDDKPLVFNKYTRSLKAGATKQLLLLGPKHHTNPPGANPSSTRQATAAAWCSRGHGQRQCLVSLHVLDNFKAPFKPRCNCWSPVG